MLDDFLIRAGLAGIGVALAAGPLGAFVLWRRMVYFGDATAHAALLGVALALALSTQVFAGVLVVALLMALVTSGLADKGLDRNAILGVLAHSALAFGLVAIALLPGQRTDLSAWLFGDILAVTRGDLAVIWAGAALILALILWRWNALLTTTVSPDLAQAAGFDARREQLILTLVMALAVAVAIKVVGALLIIAMLLIPAAAARPLARSPEMMAVTAALVGMAAVVLGLWASLRFDTPAGPSIVCAASILFALGQGAKLGMRT